MSFFTKLGNFLSDAVHPAEAAFKAAFSGFLTSDGFDKIKKQVALYESAYLLGLYDKAARNSAALTAVKNAFPHLPEQTVQFVIDTICGIFNGKMDVVAVQPTPQVTVTSTPFTVAATPLDFSDSKQRIVNPPNDTTPIVPTPVVPTSVAPVGES